MESKDIILSLGAFAVAQFIALLAAYSKMMHTVSYMRGQVKLVVHQIDKVELSVKELDGELTKVDHAQRKTAMDTDHAFEKIRDLEACIPAA